jgi:polysaccharide biosynthesis transport protein
MNKLVPLAAPVQLETGAHKPATQGDNQALQDLVAIFRRRYMSLLGIALLVAAVLAPLQLSSPKVYTATASLMFDGRERQIVGEDVVSALPADPAAVDSEARVISSRRVAESVAGDLNLFNDGEFNYELAPAPKGLAAIMPAVTGFVRSLIPRSETPASSPVSGVDPVRERTVSAVLGGLDVRRIGQTRVIEVSYTSRDPAKSAAIANAFVDQYMVAQVREKFDATQRANSWLSERITALQLETQTAERAVEDYRAAAGLLSAEGSTLTEQQIAEFQTQLVLLRADLAERDARVARMRSQLAEPGGTDQLSEVLSDPAVQQLRQQEAEVTRRLAELRENYGPEWPARQRAEAELLDVRSGIDRQVRRVVSTIEQEAAVTRQRVAELESNISQLRGQMIGNNSAEVRLRELERTASASRTLYESFLARYKETGEQGTLATPDAQLVSAAAAPETPSAPITSLALALSILGGLLVGLIAVAIMEIMESGYRTASEVENETGARHFGFVPAVTAARPDPFTWRDPAMDPVDLAAKPAPMRWLWRSTRFLSRFASFCVAWVSAPSVKPGDYLIQKPLSRFAEAIRTLRASMLLATEQQPKLVMITSSIPNEGKTTSTISVGRISAMSGAKVVVVDCDTRHKGLTTDSGLRPQMGLLEVLSGECTLDAALTKDSASSMDILPLSPVAPPHEEVFAGEAMRSLLATLRGRYDLVLLDTAPVLLVAETRLLAAEVDAVVLVARWRTTPRGLVRSSLAALKAAKAPNIGVALSRVDMQAVRLYSDGEIGAYYRAYNSYYVE